MNYHSMRWWWWRVNRNESTLTYVYNLILSNNAMIYINFMNDEMIDEVKLNLNCSLVVFLGTPQEQAITISFQNYLDSTRTEILWIIFRSFSTYHVHTPFTSAPAIWFRNSRKKWKSFLMYSTIFIFLPLLSMNIQFKEICGYFMLSKSKVIHTHVFRGLFKKKKTLQIEFRKNRRRGSI